MIKSSLLLQYRSESSASFFTSITSISLQHIFCFLYSIAYIVLKYTSQQILFSDLLNNYPQGVSIQ